MLERHLSVFRPGQQVKDAVTDLGLAEGAAVTALLKSTEVSLAAV